MNSFRHKIVVITGAGSGIGRATALAFARQGARLHLVDIHPQRLEAVRDEAAALQAITTSHVIDCTSGEQMEALAADIFQREAQVDVLQNGVGILVAAPVERLSREDWQRAIDVNLWSVINGVHAFIPRMLDQGSPSHLVNVASAAGLVGFPFTAPYSTTKFAIVGLSESLSMELYGKGVSVTAVCPGMVQSNLLADGRLQLPGSWTRVIGQAFDAMAARPERIAEQILSAIRHRRTLVVPSHGLSQLWRLKRWTGPLFHGMSRQLVRGLLRLPGKKNHSHRGPAR